MSRIDDAHTENVMQAFHAYSEAEGYFPGFEQVLATVGEADDYRLNLTEIFNTLDWLAEEAGLDVSVFWHSDNQPGVGVYEQDPDEYWDRRREELNTWDKITAIFSGHIDRTSVIKSPDVDDFPLMLLLTIDRIVDQYPEVIEDG